MKRYLIVLFLLAAGVAWATFPGSPIGGGSSGGDGNATSIADDLIVNADVNSAANIDGSKLADNTVTPPKLKASGTPDNTMYPRYKSATEFEWATPSVGSGTPAGSSGQVQYNNGGAFGAVPGAGYSSVDNSVTFPGQVIGTCADNACKGNTSNSGTITSLGAAGDYGYDRARGQLVYNDADGPSADIVALASIFKTFPIAIDNVIAAQDTNLFVWPRIPTKIIIDRIDGYASTDNVVGRLYWCASDNLATCTAIDSADWTITNATAPPFSDTSMSAGTVAAGSWLKWVTTSVGTTNANDLFISVRYREDY